MGEQSLKKSVLSGLFWKFGERAFAQGISFIVSLVLARMLMPEDYGAVAILLIFITFANVFVSDGFSAALIQKKECDSLDYSSVLIGGFGVSVVLYIVIFLCAPFIAGFYNMPILSPTLRVLALRIPLAAINSVEIAYLSKNMQFKKFFWATFLGTAGSAVVGIYMAYTGFGVWALIAQNLFNYTIDIIVLAISIGKIPPLRFSFQRVKTLMSYGYKILLTNLLFTFTNQLRSFIIGKKYSSADLAFYTKGKHFPELLSTNITGPISSVLFPAMSKVQSDISAVREIMRKCVRVITYVITPMLLGFATVSRPLVKLVLTEKWLSCVPFIWIGCIYYVFPAIHSINLEAVKAIGRSDEVFSYGILKRVVGVLALVVSLPFGVTAIAWSLVASAILSTAINAYQNKKLFNYTYKDQLIDMFPNMLTSAFTCASVYAIGNCLMLGEILTVCIQTIAGIAIYLLVSVLTKNKSLGFCTDMIKQTIKR